MLGSSSSSSAQQASTAQAQSPTPAAQPSATRRDLTSWWRRFNLKLKKDEENAAAAGSNGRGQPPASPGIFGVALQDSIKYANVAISLTDEEGKSFIYGYVPIVIAKCGVFLKEKATDVEGIFRLNGSSKRISQLQTIFNSPDRYGKGLDWTGFTVHDAANVLRRYLNQLPEPIIPLNFYERFRDPLRGHEMQAVGDMEAQEHDIGGFDEDEAIRVYQRVITELPPLNRQLLLYILDLLAVFASKSDLNRMTSANLAAIFQPGMLSHPAHDMEPNEYRLSQDVLVFLIENQDHFLIGMRGTAADEETVRQVQGGAAPVAHPTTPPPSTARPLATPVRSSSGGSAAENTQRYSGLRRNVSASSRHSTAPRPVSPGAPGSAPGNAVQRSNTVPSRKSPGLGASRFGRPSGPSTPTTTGYVPPSPAPLTPLSPTKLELHNAQTAPVTEPAQPASQTSPAPGDRGPSSREEEPSQLALAASSSAAGDRSSRESLVQDANANAGAARKASPAATPAKERSISNLFSRSPTSDGEKKDGRIYNKLRKKKRTSNAAANGSAQSSTHSLTDA